jgi:ribosome biogenesis protein MAK21
MPPKPDLASHTLSSFLDRFVYRNAKAASGGARGGSIMQPLSGSEGRGVLISNRASNRVQNPVNTEAFWKKKVEDIAVDEVFFHKYFSQVGKAKHAAGKKKNAQAAKGDENDSDNEDEIWEALVNSRPEVEGPSDDDSDMDMLDLDESDGDLSDNSLNEGNDNDEEDEASELGDTDGSGGEDDGVGADQDEESDADSDIEGLFAKELEGGAVLEPKEGKETSRQRAKKLKGLPTFASVEDYASMLSGDEDEDF